MSFPEYANVKELLEATWPELLSLKEVGHKITIRLTFLGLWIPIDKDYTVQYGKPGVSVESILDGITSYYARRVA